MKTKSKIIILIVVVLVVLSVGLVAFGSSAWDNYIDEQRKQNLAKAYDQINHNYLAHQNDFAFDLFQRIVNHDSEENLMISPLSINYALYMTYNGAEGETKVEMEEALYLNGLDPDKLNQQMKALSDYFRHGKIDLKIANSLWGCKNRVQLLEEFKNDMENYYEAKIEHLDFNDPQASEIINSWVLDRTEGKIEDMVPETIPDQVIMYLINAIYFYGNWQEPFSEKATREDPFTTPSGEEVTVDMMRLEENFSYLENDMFQAVSLPYEDDTYQMTLFLPQENTRLETLYQELSKSNWEKWQEEFTKLNGTVKLPKFEIEYDTPLNEVLQEMGMERAFGFGAADFSNMLYQSEGIFIDEVLHKSFIEVDEKGTEAAAATSVAMVETAAPMDNFLIEFNRPFFFIIENTEVNTLLFMGAVHDPST